MGSASSKAASKAAPRAAAGVRSANPAARPAVSKPTAPPRPSGAAADTTKSAAILNDARDPDFASMLNQIGHVGQAQRAATEKPLNAATTILSRRESISNAFKKEAEDNDFGGKGQSWLDALAVKKVLELKRDGWSNERIEKHLQLKAGVVDRLGGLVREA